MPTQIQFPNLARPQDKCASFKAHNFAHFLLGQLLGMAFRRRDSFLILPSRFRRNDPPALQLRRPSRELI